jgi:hypothetical protein
VAAMAMMSSTFLTMKPVAHLTTLRVEAAKTQSRLTVTMRLLKTAKQSISKNSDHRQFDELRQTRQPGFLGGFAGSKA